MAVNLGLNDKAWRLADFMASPAQVQALRITATPLSMPPHPGLRRQSPWRTASRPSHGPRLSGRASGSQPCTR